MVRKETCPACKGNKYIHVTTSDGRVKHAECPHCGGHGFNVRVELPRR